MGLSIFSLSFEIRFLVSDVSGTARYKKSASGKTVLILSIVTILEHPSTFFPLLFTPIIFAPNGATSLAIEEPRVPRSNQNHCFSSNWIAK